MSEESSTYDGASTPTIASGLEKPENLEALKSAMAKFDARDQQFFLEGLQVIEQFSKLENERLDLKTILKALAPSGGAAVVAGLLLWPLVGPDAALGASSIGGGAASIGSLLGERDRKRAIIARVRELRNAVIDVGKKERLKSVE